MPVRISERNGIEMATAIRTQMENGTYRLYSTATAQPAAASDAIPAGSVLLAEVTGMNFSAVVINGNFAEFSLTGTESDLAADATGTAAWFRESDAADAGAASPGAAGEPRIDGAVSATGGGGNMELSTTALVAGNPFNITGLTVRVPLS